MIFFTLPKKLILKIYTYLALEKHYDKSMDVSYKESCTLCFSNRKTQSPKPKWGRKNRRCWKNERSAMRNVISSLIKTDIYHDLYKIHITASTCGCCRPSFSKALWL